MCSKYVDKQERDRICSSLEKVLIFTLFVFQYVLMRVEQSRDIIALRKALQETRHFSYWCHRPGF